MVYTDISHSETNINMKKRVNLIPIIRKSRIEGILLRPLSLDVTPNISRSSRKLITCRGLCK